ncbi:MAG: hypothetical protein AAF481_04390 [Acidobacteriota bacterium]
MSGLRSLVGQYLDVQLNTGAGVRTRIVERPSRSLEAKECARLVADLRTVARSVLSDGELTYGVLTGDPERLSRLVVTVLYDRDSGQPIAFNALAILPCRLRGRDEDVLHLGLVMVNPEHRGRRLSWVLYGLTCVLLFLRRQLRPLWISNVTQVPAIVGMVAESFARVFPTAAGRERRSHDHLVLGREILRHHRSAFGVGEEAGFDTERFVITNAYTGGSDDLKKTFEEAQKHRDPVYNEMCRRELDYERGDDFLQLGQFNLQMLRRYLLKTVPRDSLPALLGHLAFAGLGTIVLPLIHWLSPRRPMGELRPRPGRREGSR